MMTPDSNNTCTMWGLVPCGGYPEAKLAHLFYLLKNYPVEGEDNQYRFISCIIHVEIRPDGSEVLQRRDMDHADEIRVLWRQLVSSGFEQACDLTLEANKDLTSKMFVHILRYIRYASMNFSQTGGAQSGVQAQP